MTCHNIIIVKTMAYILCIPIIIYNTLYCNDVDAPQVFQLCMSLVYTVNRLYFNAAKCYSAALCYLVHLLMTKKKATVQFIAQTHGNRIQ